MSVELCFAESILLRTQDEHRQQQRRASVTLLHGEAKINGVPLQLYSAQSLDIGGAVTVVDCVASEGCPLQVSGDDVAARRRVPLVSCALERLISRIRDACALTRTGQGLPPRLLLLGTGDSACASWALRTLVSAVAANSSIVLDISLAAQEIEQQQQGCNSDSKSNENTTIIVPSGAVSLRFLTQGGIVESFQFFIGARSVATAADAIVDVLTTANEMISAVVAANLEFASAPLIVNAGDVADAAAATLLLPKVLRALRITHIAPLIGATPSAVAVMQAVSAAAAAVVRGIVVDAVRISWPAAAVIMSAGSEDAAAPAALQITTTTKQTTAGLVQSISRYFSCAARLVLDVSRLELLDATTLKPLRFADVKPRALCGVAAPLGSTTASLGGARRIIVGYVVVVDIGTNSTLVVIAPDRGDLPSRTLLVANELQVPTVALPSVLDTV